MQSEQQPLEGRIVLPIDGRCCPDGRGDSTHVHPSQRRLRKLGIDDNPERCSCDCMCSWCNAEVP